MADENFKEPQKLIKDYINDLVELTTALKVGTLKYEGDILKLYINNQAVNALNHGKIITKWSDRFTAFSVNQPLKPVIGDVYYDTLHYTLKGYDGNRWIRVNIDYDLVNALSVTELKHVQENFAPCTVEAMKLGGQQNNNKKDS